jgi:AraC-like DNA-binding protein
MQPDGKPHGLSGPCPAAMGIIGVPARKWRTRADLYAQLLQARKYMDTCPLDSPRLQDFATEAGVSVHHFLRLFHEVNGVTPLQYLTARRVKVAQGLLKNTELSVSEIAVEVGLSGPSALGRLFRRHVGCSSTEYRARFSQSR